MEGAQSDTDSLSQIFVVDSTCSEDELQETQGELEKCLRDPTLVGIPLLVMCNKQDLAEAKPVEQVGKRVYGLPKYLGFLRKEKCFQSKILKRKRKLLIL